MEQTKALRKIASLKKKIKVIQGGQGAGKTIAILIIIINHASSKPGKEIVIASSELTKMRYTVIKDFVKVMKSFGLFQDNRFLAGTLYRFPNGSFIKFIGLDKDDVGKGFRGDVFYLNEGNKVQFESYREIASRFKNIFIDFNPNVEFWVHDEIVPRDDADHIKLTYQDNEFLDKAEVEEIERYYKLGYNEEGEIINKYWANKWKVYGLGEVGGIDGVVFDNWSFVEDLPKEAKLLYYGCDFGYSVSKFAVVGIYQYNESYIIDEVVYKTNLTNPQAAQEMINCNYQSGMLTYCDSAEPKSIQELCDNGINAIACESKKDIKAFAIQKLNTVEFFVTKKSVNLTMELRSYIWDEKTGKPEKSDKDHLMDALLYAIGSDGKYTGTYI